MSVHRIGLRRSITSILSLFCIFSLLASCQSKTGISPTIQTSPVPDQKSQSPDYQMAEVTFKAELPDELLDGENLYLELLDEVTGLALNAARVQMVSEDRQNFIVKLPIVIGSVLKYRYVRDKEPVGIEYTSQKQQVRYRMYHIDGPSLVLDTISAWKSTPSNGKLGRIFGQVVYAESNAPVVNALVVAGGMHTMTASDGSFIIEGLPPSVHNIVVYSLDGTFQTFQQGAVVAAEATTPAFIQVKPTEMVDISFLVQPPQDGLEGLPVRLVGNTFSLGNTFADLKGGVSVLAARAPIMQIQPDGRYLLKVRLPAGSDLRYKYTLGDGYWNAERTIDGKVRTRQLIVPGEDTSVQDSIDTWKSGGHQPISISVTVPPTTSASDTLSIQFNPFGWVESIPMWRAGNDRWFYVLYDPLYTLEDTAYRYCRNDQCGIADSSETSGFEHSGKLFQVQENELTIEETIPAWVWMEENTEPVVVPSSEIIVREEYFEAGVGFQAAYHPSWQAHLGAAFKNVIDIGANTVILSPTWHLTHQTPPIMEVVAGRDPLWLDLTQMTAQAQQNGLNVSIHPVLSYDEDPETWWMTAKRDDGWWQSWFDRYRTFILYHADLAAQTGSTTLILGDESILPALPGGMLADGGPSGVPANAGEHWDELLADIRTHYGGELAWFISYAGKLPALPSFIDSFDRLYVEISSPVAASDQASVLEIEEFLAQKFDEDILPLYEKEKQQITIGLSYPSVKGAMDGCVEAAGNCLPSDLLQQPAQAYEGSELSLSEQANVYSAILSILNQRSWITGFYTAGYFPPASLKDMSTSVRGKPASDVLWYWYARLLGRETQ